MRVFISSDIEGTAGIVHWEQVLNGPEYEGGRTLLENEVNAAIDGAADAGATSFLVNDAHYLMQNLRPERLHGRASLVSGKHKPLYMMEGLDGSFDAAFLVSYHGSISAQTAVLSHTYNPSVVYHAELNGHVVGESGINALVARHYDVPIALVTGDDATAEEMRAHRTRLRVRRRQALDHALRGREPAPRGRLRADPRGRGAGARARRADERRPRSTCRRRSRCRSRRRTTPSSARGCPASSAPARAACASSTTSRCGSTARGSRSRRSRADPGAGMSASASRS